MLAAKVAAGDLPPVEDRIPADPYVFRVAEIGTYGGTLHAYGANNRSWNDLMDAPPRNAKMLLPQADGSIGEGELAYDFQWSNSGTTLTLYLREGIRWSDGDEVTTEDYIFAIEDVHQNEEIGTWGSAMGAGIVEEVIAVDDYRMDRRAGVEEPVPGALLQAMAHRLQRRR